MIDAEINFRDGIYVIEKAGEVNAIFGGEGLAEFLSNRGYEVEMIIINESIKPLDLLKKAMAHALQERREVPDEVVKDLIGSHLEFVDTIIQSNSYEEAYVSWKNKMSKSTIHSEKYNKGHIRSLGYFGEP